MTIMQIAATAEDLTRLIEEHPHLNLRSLGVEALGKITLDDGDDDRVVDVPFSMLEEGDWRIRTYSEHSRPGAKNYGGLAWDEVSHGRLRGLFHRLHPDLPRRVDCSGASANIPEALMKMREARDAVEYAKNYVAHVVAEGDEYGAALLGRLSEVVTAVEAVYTDLVNVGVRVNYNEAVPAMRLYDTRGQPCDFHKTYVHELSDCSSCDYAGGHA